MPRRGSNTEGARQHPAPTNAQPLAVAAVAQPPPAQAPEPPTDCALGSLVEIQGLTSDEGKQLNGCCGVRGAWNAVRRHFEITLENGSPPDLPPVVGLRAANFTPAGPECRLCLGRAPGAERCCPCRGSNIRFLRYRSAARSLLHNARHRRTTLELLQTPQFACETPQQSAAG